MRAAAAMLMVGGLLVLTGARPAAAQEVNPCANADLLLATRLVGPSIAAYSGLLAGDQPPACASDGISAAVAQRREAAAFVELATNEKDEAAKAGLVEQALQVDLTVPGIAAVFATGDPNTFAGPRALLEAGFVAEARTEAQKIAIASGEAIPVELTAAPPYAGAQALLDAGFVAEARTEAQKVAIASGEAVPDQFKAAPPYAGAQALLDAGFDEEATTATKEQAKATGAPVPEALADQSNWLEGLSGWVADQTEGLTDLLPALAILALLIILALRARPPLIRIDKVDSKGLAKSDADAIRAAFLKSLGEVDRTRRPLELAPAADAPLDLAKSFGATGIAATIFGLVGSLGPRRIVRVDLAASSIAGTPQLTITVTGLLGRRLSARSLVASTSGDEAQAIGELSASGAAWLSVAAPTSWWVARAGDPAPSEAGEAIHVATGTFWIDQENDQRAELAFRGAISAKPASVPGRLGLATVLARTTIGDVASPEIAMVRLEESRAITDRMTDDQTLKSRDRLRAMNVNAVALVHLSELVDVSLRAQVARKGLKQAKAMFMLAQLIIADPRDRDHAFAVAAQPAMAALVIAAMAHARWRPAPDPTDATDLTEAISAIEPDVLPDVPSVDVRRVIDALEHEFPRDTYSVATNYNLGCAWSKFFATTLDDAYAEESLRFVRSALLTRPKLLTWASIDPSLEPVRLRDGGRAWDLLLAEMGVFVVL